MHPEDDNFSRSRYRLLRHYIHLRASYALSLPTVRFFRNFSHTYNEQTPHLVHDAAAARLIRAFFQGGGGGFEGHPGAARDDLCRANPTTADESLLYVQPARGNEDGERGDGFTRGGGALVSGALLCLSRLCP